MSSQSHAFRLEGASLFCLYARCLAGVPVSSEPGIDDTRFRCHLLHHRGLFSCDEGCPAVNLSQGSTLCLVAALAPVDAALFIYSSPCQLRAGVARAAQQAKDDGGRLPDDGMRRGREARALHSPENW